MAVGAAAQQQQPAPPPAPAAPQQPTFRVSVDLVTTDVIVRDSRDQFVADLKAGEFEVFEDGVKQDIVSLVLTHGGRVYNVQAPPPPPAQEGIILPPSRPTNDAAGRVFLLFIDDLHLDFQQTPRTRDLLKRMLRNLIHEGDMFGIVTTGTSSISQQLTYDRQVLDSAINRVTGGGLKPEDIIKGMQGAQGPTELRYRAHVAFSTANELMKNLEKLQNRRKAVLYISSGYDFNPFETSRLEHQASMYGMDSAELQSDPFMRTQQQGTQFAEADLVRELAELTRAANRANATFYTIDPRGLVAGPDIGDNLPMQEWQTYIRETQDSLRVLAEQTGGIAVVNQNDFDKALKRIDAETSDYYVLGYYSSNPDPLKRTRRIEVKAKRDGLNVWSRTSYSLRPLPPPSQ
jgi:VWFA-related protein